MAALVLIVGAVAAVALALIASLLGSIIFDHRSYLHDEKRLFEVAGSPPQSIDRRPNLTNDQFMQEYFLWGRPVVIPGGAAHWPVIRDKLWNLSSLAEVGIGIPEDFPDFCNVRRDSAHRRCLRKGWSLPRALSFPRASIVGGEFNPPAFCEMFYASTEEGEGSEAHLDANCGATWVAQITGRKHWVLHPPQDYPHVLQNTQRASTWHFAQSYETILEPGDVLVFHVGWVHSTKQVGGVPALSMNMYLAQVAVWSSNGLSLGL